MSEIQMTHLSFRDDVHTGRDRIHETALHDARVATDYRRPALEASARPSLATRLRLAFAGGPAATTEACSCAA